VAGRGLSAAAGRAPCWVSHRSISTAVPSDRFRLFGIAMHAIVGFNHMTDTQCGFKFFTRDAAR
jgi:hypothetical protein